MAAGANAQERMFRSLVIIPCCLNVAVDHQLPIAEGERVQGAVVPAEAGKSLFLFMVVGPGALHPQAAVEVEDLTGNELGLILIARQEQDGRGDILRLAIGMA